jgi:hypothetical protein
VPKRRENNSQCPTFTEHEEIALKLLQSLLHHAELKVPAPSTTKHRIAKLKEIQQVSPELERQLEKASTTVVGWVWKNKAALYSMVKKVLNKNDKMLSSGFYEVDELANILFLESLRIMYNYQWGSEAQPLTYLISTLNRRKHVLLAQEVPYASEFDAFVEDEDAGAW